MNELAEKYPDLGQLVCVQSDVWKELLGAEWVAKNPEIPFFLSPADVLVLQAKQGLEHGKLAAAVERVLCDARVFSDRSQTAETVKGAYRLLLAGYFEDLAARVDQRLRASVEVLAEQAPAAVLALNLWSEDPRADPAAWFLWLMAGSAFLRAGDHAKAAEYLGFAAALNAKSPEALNELGLCRAVQGDYVSAERLFKDALAIAPDDFRSLSHLGAVCLQHGRKREALDYLGRALRQKPDDEKVSKLHQLALIMKD